MQEEQAESETETASEPEGELRVEAEQMTGVEDALASPTAAARFEEPPSESEVRLHQAGLRTVMTDTSHFHNCCRHRPLTMQSPVFSSQHDADW